MSGEAHKLTAMETAQTTTITPTVEQQAALDLFSTGHDLVIEAGAGTGKTSTLRLLAASTDRQGVYVAFNRAIVEEAKAKMPDNVSASTAHALAFRVTGMQMRHRLNGRRVKSSDIAKMLGINPIEVVGPLGRRRLAAGYLGGLVQRAVVSFCQTADERISGRHVPRIEGIDGFRSDGTLEWANNRIVQRELEPALRRAWADLMDPNGVLPYRHDHYLKAWQLSGPRIACDFIMFDEAQDANPVMRAIVEAQTHAQRVYVGDSQQQIYSFTGAVNALAQVNGNRTMLTKSFRFGPEIAAAANSVLALLDTDMRIEGAGRPGRVEQVAKPDVILTRTNASAVRLALGELVTGGRPSIIGGFDDVIRFAAAAMDLKNNGWTSHPDLSCFKSWGEVQDYVDEDPNGSELSLLVDLVDEFGADVISERLKECTAPENATLQISTAHKAKGLEWDVVKLASDFPTGLNKKGEECKVGAEELRLLYVAVTRAQVALDTGGNPLINATTATPVAAAPMVEMVTPDDLVGTDAQVKVKVAGTDCEFGCPHTGVLDTATYFGTANSGRYRLMIATDSGRTEMAIVGADAAVTVERV